MIRAVMACDRIIADSLPDEGSIILVETPWGKARVERIRHDSKDNYIELYWVDDFYTNEYRFSVKEDFRSN